LIDHAERSAVLHQPAADARQFQMLYGIRPAEQTRVASNFSVQCASIGVW
jgi:hypothetical protein